MVTLAPVLARNAPKKSKSERFSPGSAGNAGNHFPEALVPGIAQIAGQKD